MIPKFPAKSLSFFLFISLVSYQRTGRAGLAGLAVSLLSHDEQPQLEAIERLLNTRLPQEWLKGFEPSPVVHEENSPRRSAGRSSEKRKLKAQLKIHAQRGKKAR